MPICSIQKAGRGCWGRRAIIQCFKAMLFEGDLNLHPVNKQQNSTTQRINVECVTEWRVAATHTSLAQQLLTKRLSLLHSPLTLPLVFFLLILHRLSVWAGGKPLSLWQSVKSRISLCNHRRYLIIYFHYRAFHKTPHGSNLGLEFLRVENLFLAFYSLK